MFDKIIHLNKISNLEDECECLICKKIFKKYSALGSHLKYEHNINSKNYYDKYILNYDIKCSCGNERKFNSIKHGYIKSCGLNCKNRNKNENNPMFSKRGYKRPEHSKFMKNNSYSKGNHSNLGKNIKFSDIHKAKIREHLKRLNERGFENKGGRCKFYKIENLIVQGKYELYFAMNSELDLIKPKAIKTPFGLYTPDFEVDEYFIEIKSTITFKNCIKSIQYKKIKWVRNNIKNVKIIVLNENKVYSFLKDYNLKSIQISK